MAKTTASSSATPLAYVRSADAPVLPAPANTVGWQGWMRANLFSTPLNAIMSLLLGAFIVWYLVGFVNWPSSPPSGPALTARLVCCRMAR